MNKLYITLLAALLAVACGKPGTEGGGGTDPVKLTAPTNVQVKGKTDNTLTFQWDPVQGAISYEWKLTLEGAAHKSGTANGRNTTVDGLTAGTGYDYIQKVTVNVAAIPYVETANTYGTTVTIG